MHLLSGAPSSGLGPLARLSPQSRPQRWQRPRASYPPREPGRTALASPHAGPAIQPNQSCDFASEPRAIPICASHLAFPPSWFAPRAKIALALASPAAVFDWCSPGRSRAGEVDWFGFVRSGHCVAESESVCSNSDSARAAALALRCFAARQKQPEPHSA